MVITVRVPAAGVSTAGIVLSINNGTNYYPVVRNVSTVISTEYAVNSTIVLVFNADQTASAYLTSNTKSTITGCWQIADANSTYSNASLGNGYATCSTAAATAAKVASLSSYSLSTGGAVSVKFTYDVPANATLNVNSKGAKAMYYRGAKIPAGIIKAGDVATFVYSTYYHLIAIDRWQKDIDDMLALKGAANGFAELDANGKVPTSQLPAANGSQAGITIVYPAASCDSFTTDTGAVTPAAAKKAVNTFAITKVAGGTLTNNSSSQKDEPSLQWKQVGTNTPYIGFAKDQTDGTFIVSSLKGTNYSNGLAIGGGSGNLLWKGNRVLDNNDLTSINAAINNKLDETDLKDIPYYGDSSDGGSLGNEISLSDLMPKAGGKFTGAVEYKTLTGGNITSTGTITGSKVYGAVWNDYAEFRQATGDIEPGRVVCENGDDTVSLSVKRMQPGAMMVSDTYGFAIGETDKCKCPIAVAGRVLMYSYEKREKYKPGDAVCSGPNGTVSKMSRLETILFPDRILGTVSSIPDYEFWGEENIEIKNRIWINKR